MNTTLFMNFLKKKIEKVYIINSDPLWHGIIDLGTPNALCSAAVTNEEIHKIRGYVIDAVLLTNVVERV
jgi:hypothetical protein